MDRQSDPPRDDAVSADEASASEARLRLRAEGIIAIEPDERIGVLLAPGEKVVAVRRSVSLERRRDYDDPHQALHGDLYVTTTRLVHLGHIRVDVPLAAIREAGVAAGALRLIVNDGRGVEIRTSDPCVLRVQIAAVRETARTAASGAAGSQDVAEG